MNYRQYLPGFGEPKDGFHRINTDSKNGGIIVIVKRNLIVTRLSSY